MLIEAASGYCLTKYLAPRSEVSVIPRKNFFPPPVNLKDKSPASSCAEDNWFGSPPWAWVIISWFK